MTNAPSRARVFFSVCALAAVTSTAAAGEVTVEVDWGKPTGRTATRLHYGLNAFHGTNPDVFGTPGLEAYKKNLAFMRPGIVRIHTWEMTSDSTTSKGGWWKDPKGPNYAWDREKIKNTFDGTPDYGQTWMVNIPVWPGHLGTPVEGKNFHDWLLKPTEYDAFANFCAELVRIINIEQKRGVKYFEVPNERELRYANDMPALAELYSRAARAMKKVDPTIKVGGPAFTDPWHTTVEPFIKGAIADLDFISYHTYTQWDLKNLRSTTSLLGSADGLAASAARIAGFAKKYAPMREIELFHNEFNLSVASDDFKDPRLTNIVSALYDALALASIASSPSIKGAMAWNESDGWFGKMAAPGAGAGLRPAASVFHLFNTFMTGPIVTTASSARTSVTPFAVAEGTRRAMVLVNRDETTSHKAKLTSMGGGFAPDANVKVYQLTRCDLRGSSGTASKLLPADGLELPALSVTAIVEGTQETIPAGGIIAMTPSACQMIGPTDPPGVRKDAGAPPVVVDARPATPADAGVADARPADAAGGTTTDKVDAGSPVKADAAPRPQRPGTDPSPGNGDDGEPEKPAATTASGGCGCEVGARGGGASGALGGAFLVAMLLLRRRRR
jgi:xylan 1,4-beta-xylosidase